MTRAPTTKRYHHGELRSALIAAALVMLERDGPAAITLRGLARVLGVSPMAPYHHFDDRAALLAAVAAAGFDRLTQRKIESQAQESDAPKSSLIAGTASYVAFVIENPNLFRLMLSNEFADQHRYPDLRRAAAAPAGLLISRIGDLLAGTGQTALSPRDCAQMLWGFAHGIGTLALDGQIAPADADRIARAGARSIIEGWL
jgi:AcrR family transcriptional regulator